MGDISDYGARLVTNWLTVLDEEAVVDKPCLLQMLARMPSSQEFIVSFDRSLYTKESATYDKWMLTETLLKTLKSAGLPLQTVRLLVHHTPLDDDHLDFSCPWPGNGFCGSPSGEPIQREWCLDQDQQPRFTIMLDPAGDAQRTGRVIDGNFERGLTLQCAEGLKEALEAKAQMNNCGVRVVLARLPGETIDPLQNAAFANKLQVNLYLSIHFYQEEALELPLFLYYYCSDPAGDGWSAAHDPLAADVPLALTPFNQAHAHHFKENVEIAYRFGKELIKRSSAFTVNGPYGIPFKPLLGIARPALACECGLKNKDDWKQLVPILADALWDMITQNREVKQLSHIS